VPLQEIEVVDINGRNILVIGGAGLIGSHVVEALLETTVGKVTIYDNFCRGTYENLKGSLKDERCCVFPLGGDILHTDILEKAVSEADAVVHLAALWLLHCHEFPESAFDVNVRGTFNVLESCRRHGIEKVVYSSSASVYGDAVSMPMTEEHPFNNWTFYGATKVAGEQMIRAYHKRYGLDAIGLRYMNVYGPRQDYRGAYIAVMMKILDRIDRGESPEVFGDGSQSYDFVHVRDVARANVCALTSDCEFGFFNVGRGVQTSIKELTELLLKITDREDLGIQYNPAGQTFVTNRVGCPKAAEKEIGYRWSVDLEEGMRSLVKWRKEHKVEVERRRVAVEGN